MSGNGVFVLDAAACQKLRTALDAAGYQFRSLDYAHFQARGDGVVVSCYRSGKLVVQGKGAEAFRAQYLGGAEASAAKTGSREDAPLPGGADSLGSDEAGKGDTFGGLVVCAFAIPAADLDELLATKVADSKTMTDSRIRELAPFLRDRFEFEERDLDAATYNEERMRSDANVNKLLTRLHADCIASLQPRAGALVAIVDRFSPRAPVSKLLKVATPGLKVHEVPRAERHPAVAAASVLARDTFLRQIRALSDELAIDVPLGSGAPVKKALDRLVAVHGREILVEDALRKAVKTHFKNEDSFRSRQ